MLSLMTPFRMREMVIVEEEVFVAAVRCECHRCYPKAGESSLKPIVPRKWTCIAPLFPKSTYKSVAHWEILCCKRSDAHEVSYALAQGSLAGAPADAANLRASKPVRLPGGGAIVIWPARPKLEKVYVSPVGLAYMNGRFRRETP